MSGTRPIRSMMAETLYARFGHWLAENDIDDDTLTDINTYAMGGAGTIGQYGSHLAVCDTDDTLMDTSATYTGEAAGMSLHKEFDGQGAIVPGSLQSAAFTADVELTATFGDAADAATLGGTVSNFEGGATDPDWSVILLTRGFDRCQLSATALARQPPPARTVSGRHRRLAQSGGRPTGIFGGFNAHFSDGHAAGAYATRK